MYFLKYIVFIVVLVFLGIILFSLMFSDYGPGETLLTRILLLVLIVIASGLLTGYFIYERWWLSGLVSWGTTILLAVALVNMIRFQIVSPEAILLVVPFPASLISGYAGRAIRLRTRAHL